MMDKNKAKPDDLFFSNVIHHLSPQSTKLVVVLHAVPGVEIFVDYLHRVLPIALLLPKQSSMDQNVVDRLTKSFPVLHYSRNEINEHPDSLLFDIQSHVKESNFAIIDVGGYFAPLLNELAHVFQDQLVGIVENTENGHQKYEHTLLLKDEHLPFPIMSVARSPLKSPEDYMVGQAIAFSAEAMLRDYFSDVLTGKHVLVIGYGKIGQSIAEGLRKKVRKVSVYDQNPSQQMLALAHNFASGQRDILLSEADLIFCATGNQSISTTDLDIIKDKAQLFLATSGDDEVINYERFLKQGHKDPHHEHVWVMQNPSRTKHVYLCNDGKSINFLHGGIVGPFIRTVQAELLCAAVSLQDVQDYEHLTTLDTSERQLIAETWLDFYLKPHVMIKPST
ncbi:NAD(P)-dependent oxidoreductase [Shouchella sp. 1P09AA]|uniref:NAD(P)-dependent oxidoreductase n=1 Tax=unclassified Shouchella TaxID=2893065 RepID=UPI0039A11BE1